LAGHLAQAGMAAFPIDYQFAPYPAAALNTLTAVRFLRQSPSRFHIDPDEVALFGLSAGGTIAASAAALAGGSGAVQAVVSWSGLLDFDAASKGRQSTVPFLVNTYVFGSSSKHGPDRAIERASPINQIRKGRHRRSWRTRGASSFRWTRPSCTRRGSPRSVSRTSCSWSEAATPGATRSSP